MAKRGHSNPRRSRLSPAVRRECIERNLSPGGSADLLILTGF
ncbi:triphosphoribosyl-dephospho-CoA synthase [Escherichia coli]